MNIVAMVLILTPSVPPVLRAMFAIPNAALQNAMACRVYRQLKLGLIREDDSSLMRSSTYSTTNHIRFAAKIGTKQTMESTELQSMEIIPSGRSQQTEKTLVVKGDADVDVEIVGIGSGSKEVVHPWDSGEFV